MRTSKIENEVGEVVEAGDRSCETVGHRKDLASTLSETEAIGLF